MRIVLIFISTSGKGNWKVIRDDIMLLLDLEQNKDLTKIKGGTECSTKFGSSCVAYLATVQADWGLISWQLKD